MEMLKKIHAATEFRFETQNFNPYNQRWQKLGLSAASMF